MKALIWKLTCHLPPILKVNMAKRDQLAQKIEPILTDDTANTQTVHINIVEDCNSISDKCDAIITKIKIKKAITKIKIKRDINE
jgi:hypothetical protein